MAKLTKWALFLRVFAITMLAGSAGRGQTADEAEAWQRASQQDTVSAYYRYLSLYPTGEYIDRALERLRRLDAIGEAAPGRQIPRLGPSDAPAGPAQPQPPATDPGDGVYQ